MPGGGDDLVRETLADAARRWERIVLWARVLIGVAVAARSSLLWLRPPMHVDNSATWMVRPTLIGTAIFIAAALLLGRQAKRIEVVVLYSVALDALGAFASLAPNALWPWQGYLGLINMPDLAGLLVVTFAAGFRLSRRAALLGGALNFISFAVLMAIDWRVAGPRDRPLAWYFIQYSMFAIFLGGATGLAVMVATLSRRLVERAARAALQATHAKRNLDTILHEHHDVRSVLSAAQLNADLLMRKLDGADQKDLADHLRADLREVESRINQIKAQTLAELVALEEKRPVDVHAIAEELLAQLRPRFPEVVLRLSADGRPRAALAGGDGSLRRILHNLVVNACEGDGRSRARSVEVRLAERGEGVSVEVRDDGPGFPGELLGRDPGASPSTKPGGSGIGLGVVAALIAASGGRLERGNLEAGGARVAVELLRYS